MLEIKNLHAGVEGKEILKGIDPDDRRRRSARHHGPERAGKSTLASVAGRARGYEVTAGRCCYRARTCWSWTRKSARARGVPGVSVPGRNPRREQHVFPEGGAERDPEAPRAGGARRDGVPELVKEKMKLLELDERLLQRSVNEGFSGGEKKRNEIFQMAVLEPTLAILDETDSGLDIDALKIVAEGREHAPRARNGQSSS